MMPVLIDRLDAIGVITLNRPEKRNALDLSMRVAIAGAVTALDDEPAIRAIVITGNDKAFAAGADLSLLVDQGSQGVADLNLGQYWAPLARSRTPLIAAVSGFALGAGCELAMMCDIIICDASARFGQPEAKVGIMPGAGGTQRLIRAVGKSAASLMLMTGETINGERAYQLGLAAEFVTDGSVLERATTLAHAAAKLPPKVLEAIKRTLGVGADLPLDAALALENREFLLLFDTEDKLEGMRAFLERRAPEFNGL
jgi:enoyl-CoA hydratase